MVPQLFLMKLLQVEDTVGWPFDFGLPWVQGKQDIDTYHVSQ